MGSLLGRGHPQPLPPPPVCNSAISLIQESLIVSRYALPCVHFQMVVVVGLENLGLCMHDDLLFHTMGTVHGSHWQQVIFLGTSELLGRPNMYTYV